MRVAPRVDLVRLRREGTRLVPPDRFRDHPSSSRTNSLSERRVIGRQIWDLTALEFFEIGPG